MTTPSTKVSRLSELQSTSRSQLDELLDSTPLGHRGARSRRAPGDLSDRLRQDRRRTGHSRLDGFTVDARAGRGAPRRPSRSPDWTESWWHAAHSNPRSATAAPSSSASSNRCPMPTRMRYLERLTDTFLPGRTAELRDSTRKELAATLPLRLPIGADNWSLKVSDGWPGRPRRGHRRRRLGRCGADVGRLRRAVARPRPAVRHPGARVGASAERHTAVSRVARCGGTGLCGGLPRTSLLVLIRLIRDSARSMSAVTTPAFPNSAMASG